MQNTTSRGIIWFFLVIFLISFFMLGRLLWPFLSIIVMASVVAGVFAPVYKFFAKKLKPFFASLTTCILIFLILFVPVALFTGIVSKQALDLTAKSGMLKNHVQNLIESSRIIEKANRVFSDFNIEPGEQLNNAISDVAKFVGGFLYKQTKAIASNVFRLLINFFIMLFITYFLLIDGHKLISFIIDLSPLPDDQDNRLIQKFKDMAFAVLLINGLSGLVQGTLGGIVFALFGFRFALLWGVTLGLAAFLPVLGIPVIFIPVAIYLMFTGQVGASIFFIVFCLVVSITIDNFLKPKLLGERVKIHPLLVFLSIIGGLKLFGILGIIYGPLVVTAFLTLTDIYYTSYKMMMIESDGK